MNKSQIVEFLKKHKQDFLKRYQISDIALFGSYAREENNSNSDIDIAIKTKLMIILNYMTLKMNLKKSSIPKLML